jgi:acetyl esterase/lipase
MTRKLLNCAIGLLFAGAALSACLAGPASAQQRVSPTAAVAPKPDFVNEAYAPPEPANGKGHLLDIYLPKGKGPFPVVILTNGSAWMADTGKEITSRSAEMVDLMRALHARGIALAAVSVRSSSQAVFPAQLHDSKAAVRWLRVHAADYNLDGAHIGNTGTSSGAWQALITATTGDAPEMEGKVGLTGVSSAIQAAVAFYPATDLSLFDQWLPFRCDPNDTSFPKGCREGKDSVNSKLIGCAVSLCPEKVQAANPARYISRNDPPIMIFHGESDFTVPWMHSFFMYNALNKACRDAVFVSLPYATHDPFIGYPERSADATIRTTSTDCSTTGPKPYQPTWEGVVDFFAKHLKPGAAQ